MKRIILIVLPLFLLALLFAESNIFVRVIVNRANIRLKASVHSKIIGTGKKGENYRVINSKGKWYLILFKGKQGYIHKSTVKEIPVKEKTEKPQTKRKVEKKVKREIKKEASVKKKMEVDGQDIEKLKKTAVIMRKDSIAFLQLIKEMRIEKEKPKVTSIGKVKIVKDGCNIYETKDVKSRVIYNPRYNDEFEIMERYENLYKIRLQDKREGWISEKDIQLITVQKKENLYKATGVTKAQLRQFIMVAKDIYSRIVQGKTIADKVFRKYDNIDINSSAKAKKIYDIYKRIEKYYTYANGFFMRYIEKGQILGSMKGEVLKRISAWGEILLGPSNYSTEYHDSYLNIENKGIVSDFSFGAQAIINAKSNVGLNFSMLNDVIQTPYSTSDISVKYSYDNNDNLGVNLGVSMNSYKDKSDESLGVNDYSKMGFNLDSRYFLNTDTRILFNYNFMNYSYKNNKDNSFSVNNINTKVEYFLSPKAQLYLNLRGGFGSSESAFHDYSNIKTKMGYISGNINSKMDLTFSYEMLNYKELEISDYRILQLGIYKNKRKSGKNSYYYLDLVSKSFPNNTIENYNQIKGKYSISKYGKNSKNFSLSFYTNLYGEVSDHNFTELRFDIGSVSSGTFFDLSSFIKLWHKSTSENGEVVRPHVVDLYGKFGINTGFFRVGPTIGVHFLLSSEEGVSLIKRDGNLFRVGGFAEGNINFGKGSFFNLRAAYEYGFVYNQELSVNPWTGIITKGDILQRHPTTLQLSFLLGLPIPVYENLQFTVKGSYYKIATDMDKQLSINPLLRNKIFKLIAGIKFRYN
jgi:uncharacterized protein YgiM (DUF1202 family)